MRSSIQKFLFSVCLLAGVLSVAGNVFGQVLNLSQDLVSLGIATSNMTPDMPSLDARPLFQAGVSYASAHNIPTVIADRGSYYFLSLNSPYQHAYLNQISNVTVDLRHSDLYFAQSNINAIAITNSSNVTLENFTVDYLLLPFTQLTVTGVSGTTVTFQQLGTYPLPSTFNSLTVPSGYLDSGYFAFVFHNGQELRTTGRMAVVATSPPSFSDTSLQLAGTEPWAQPSDIATIQPGDTLVLTWRAGIATISVQQSTGFTLHNVSIYASGYLGVGVGLSSGTTIDHVQVIPRPGTDRLISTNADGIHLTKAGANNVVSSNTIRRGCDDGIAIDGQWYAIVNAPNSGNTVQVARNGTGSLQIGQAFEFINVLDATIAGTATILDENPEPSAQTGKSGELITLTLDQTISGLQPNFGVTPADPNLRGAGTVISGNLVQEEVFARGIYPSGTKNVTVTDNMTQATNQAGILVTQDEGLTYSYKTGPTAGLVIQNNIVDHALGYGTPSNQVLGLTASINVAAYDEHFDWVSTQSLSNISITGNFVTNSAHSGIRMENVEGGEVRGNLIANSGTQPGDYLWWYQFTNETLAQIETECAEPLLVVNSTSVTDTNNTTNASPVKNASFADGSYRFAPESIVVALGQNFTTGSGAASGPPLPHKLAGLEVKVKDSAGVMRLAGLYYAGPSQVTYVMPEGTAPGVATVTVGTQVSGALISSVAPALFSADGTGGGVALATAERITGGGQQISETVYQCSSTCVAVPLDLGKPSDTPLVYFQGTGIRGRSSLGNVVAEVGGRPAKVEHAGKLPHSDPGMDYVTVKIPHSLAGAGEVPVVLTVDGFTADVVTISIK